MLWTFLKRKDIRLSRNLYEYIYVHTVQVTGLLQVAVVIKMLKQVGQSVLLTFLCPWEMWRDLLCCRASTIEECAHLHGNRLRVEISRRCVVTPVSPPLLPRCSQICRRQILLGWRPQATHLRYLQNTNQSKTFSTPLLTPWTRFTKLRRCVVVVRYQLHVDLRITPTLFHKTQLACDVTPMSLPGRVGMAVSQNAACVWRHTDDVVARESRYGYCVKKWSFF